MSPAVSEDIFSWACRHEFGIEPPWPESIAISGPLNINTAQWDAVTRDFEIRICECDTIYSGAQFGVDTIGAKVARAQNANLILVAPEQGHNTRLYALADEIIHVPGSYLDRDDRLAEEADALVAYPQTATEMLRSGTWATVRRFRARGKPVTIVPLDVLC